MVTLANYFDRRAIAGHVAKRYAKLLHRGRQFVESAEANEAQGVVYERLGAVGDGAFGPVSLRDGGAIVVNSDAETVTLGEATVWAGGYMHAVPSATLEDVPMTGTVAIGVAVTETAITDVEDVGLKGIVPNTESHGEPLAARLRYDAVWSLDGDPFYPIHTLIDGQIPNEVVAPQDTAAELAVERHVRETHGSHIVDGFSVSPGGYDDGTGEQTYIIAAGTLRAYGREVRRTTDQRYRRVEDPTLRQVNGETHLYPSGGVVTLNNGPIADVQTVTVIKEVTESITHSLAGGSDALPNTPVYSIESAVVGGTTYVKDTDYQLTADAIDWSLAGGEPSPGTSVTVTYRYVATVTPEEIGRETITLESAVVGQPVTVQYRHKLRRIDVVAVDMDGAVVYLKGLSSRYSPVPPPVPSPLAPLARVDNQWAADPIITDVDQRKLTEADVRAMLRTLLDVSDLVSLVSLQRDIQERDPASRRGQFVDAFRDDNQRDLGIDQDAAIVDGILQLPVTATAEAVDIGDVPITLPFVTEPILSQPFRTEGRKINKYLAFDPLPASLAIAPAVDRWNETQTNSTSRSTSSFVQVWAYRPDLLGTAQYGTSTEQRNTSSSTSVSTSTRSLPFLRQITVDFVCSRMGPGETLDTVTFDGVDVTASVAGTPTADAGGVMVGTFTIPSNIRSGTKQVIVTGSGGTVGETSFTGQGTLTIKSYHTTRHTVTVRTTIDPVAQSFVLAAPRQVTGARVEFTAKGDATNPVVIALRPMTDSGLPSTEIFAEGLIDGDFTVSDPENVDPDNWTEGSFEFPQFVEANDWHWFSLLTDDPDHAVAVATLGDQSDPNAPRGYDARLQQWIRSNPAGGDFADGSNNRSWVIHPDTDLTFELMAARYTSLSRTVTLGTWDLSEIDEDGISDILVLLLVEQPSPDCRVRLELVRAGGEVIAFEPSVALRLDEYLTEEVTIRMVLEGTTTLSPVVMPECQILWGRLAETATYASQAIALDQSGDDLKVRTVAEVQTPGTSSVAFALGDDGDWTAQTSPTSTALGDGWVEREYLTTPVTDTEIRQQITLTGTPAHRPAVRNLRIRATEV